MRCTQVRNNLLSWFDKEIPVRNRDRVENHIAGCPACRRKAQTMRSLWDWVVPEPSLAPPSRLWPALLGRIRNRQEKSGPARVRFFDPLAQWAPAAAVMVLVGLAVSTGLFLGSVPGRNPSMTRGDVFSATGGQVPFEALALTRLDDMPSESLGGVYLALIYEQSGSGGANE